MQSDSNEVAWQVGGKMPGWGKKLIAGALSSSQGLKLLSPIGFIFLCMCPTAARGGCSRAERLSQADPAGVRGIAQVGAWFMAKACQLQPLSTGSRFAVCCTAGNGVAEGTWLVLTERVKLLSAFPFGHVINVWSCVSATPCSEHKLCRA